MTKRNKFYQIGFFTMAIAFIVVCLFVGITAIQKSMKLKLSFTANPVVYCQMKVGEELIFDNLSSQIGDGVESLSGNTLTFNQDKFASTIGVETFNLTLKNYENTGSSILVDFQNATISGVSGYSEIIASGNSSTFAVTPTSLVEISMTKVTEVSVSLGDGITLESSNLLTATSGAQCLPFGEDLQATISLEANYENPTVTFNGEDYEITDNTISIPAGDLTSGNGSIEIGAEQSGYTITFDSNGGTFASGTTITQTLEENVVYTTPEKPTKTDYFFAGWAESSTATEATWLDSQTCTADKKWYAVWLSYYSLTVTFDGEGRIYSGAGFFVFATNDPEFGFVYESYSQTYYYCLLNFTGVEEAYNATHYEGYNVYDYYAALRKGTTINSKLPNSPYTYLEPAIGLSNDVDTITLGVPQGFKVLVGITVNAAGFGDYIHFNNQPSPTPSLTHISYNSNAYYFEMPANSLSLACTTKVDNGIG